MTIKAELASQSSIIFAGRILGAGVIFAAQAAIARAWGGDVLGRYLLAIAAVNLIAVAMPLGFHTVGTYFAAEYRARGQGELLWRFLVRSYGHVVAMALAVGLIGAPLSRMLPDGLAFVGDLWLPTTLLAVATALVFVSTDVLIGLKRPFAGFFAEGLVRPMLVIGAFALTAVIAAPGAELSSMLWTLAIGYCVVAAGHFVIVVGAVREMPNSGETKQAEGRRWWRYAAPWAMIALATDFFFDIDLIVLAPMMDPETLAIFGICARIFALAAFGVTAVYSVSMPGMFESEAKSDRAEFLRKVGDANFVAGGLAVLILAGVAVFGPLVLQLFGPEFAAGALPLSILCLALVVRAVFGPASLVLSINDRPWASLPAIIGSVSVLVVANYLLVPAFGLMGAALSALLAISIWSVTLWVVARRSVSIDVSIFPRLLALVRPGAITDPKQAVSEADGGKQTVLQPLGKS